MLPVRGAPNEYFREYEKMSKNLDSEFILPDRDTLADADTVFEIIYKMNNADGRQIRPIIINGRGLFPSTEKYLLYSDSKAGKGYMVIVKRLDEVSLEQEKSKFIKTETINGVDMNVDEHGYRFFIKDIYYNITREDECEIMSMAQLKVVANNIILQANKK